MSLLFLALSASVDRFLRVGRLTPGEIHRPGIAVEVAGGKALNAARAARLSGANVRVLALGGGHTGAWLKELMQDADIGAEWVPSVAANRICTSIAHEDGRLTELYEPAPDVSDDEWWAFTERIRAAVSSGPCDWVALAGSLPPSVGPDRVAEIVACGRSTGARIAADVRGDALRAALAAGADIVKVNAREAREVVDEDLPVPLLAEGLLGRLVGHDPLAIVTDGPRGAALAAPTGTWEATGPPGGAWPVGSGDAFFGAVLASISRTPDPITALRAGIGAGAANTLQAGAGCFDPKTQVAHSDAARVRPFTGDGPS